MPRRALAGWVVAVSAMLGGCAVSPRTTVVLLPDEDGHVGTVVVTGGGGQQRIDQAYNAVSVFEPASKPSDAKPEEQAEIEQRYELLLKAQPTKPLSFVLYFVLDGVALTERSRSLLPEMIKAARARKPTEITVYGHADASGTEQRNERLSQARAQAVAELLRKSDPDFAQIEVQYFGDRSPLVPNVGQRPEPRNRRAEVVIL
jgi:peptidoglycan-associated lipoprotein